MIKRLKILLMKKSHRVLLILGLVVDVVTTIFLFVVSIVMLAMIGKFGDAKQAAANVDPNGLIFFLLNNTNVYFWEQAVSAL